MEKTNPQSKQNKNKNSNNINKNINNINNINSTNNILAFTHFSKKYFKLRAIYTQNYTDDLSKFRMGHLSVTRLPKLYVNAFDFSKRAVNMTKIHPMYLKKI